MSLALRRLVAAQTPGILSGEEVVEAGRARTVPGTESANYFPRKTIWALTNERLFVFAADRGSAPQLTRPLVVLGLGDAVTGARTEPFDDRGALLVIDASGHPAMVLMDPVDAESIVNGVREALEAIIAQASPTTGFVTMSTGAQGPGPAGGADPLADPETPDPVIAQVRATLRSGNWERARQILTAPASPARREWLFTHLAGSDLHAGLELWVGAEPDSSDAHLARGANSVLQAESLRLTADIGEAYLASLRDAERDLFRAVELDFADPVPFTPLMRSGLWLGIPFEELCMRYDESVRRMPELPGVHLATLEALSPLGVGSDDEMFAFARTTARAAAEGSPVHGLVPFAHLIAVTVSAEPERRRNVISGERASEIGVFASMSVDHPAWNDSDGGAEVTNIFAAAFAAEGDLDRARELLARKSTPRTARPWTILPDGEAIYRAVASPAG